VPARISFITLYVVWDLPTKRLNYRLWRLTFFWIKTLLFRFWETSFWPRFRALGPILGPKMLWVSLFFNCPKVSTLWLRNFFSRFLFGLTFYWAWFRSLGLISSPNTVWTSLFFESLWFQLWFSNFLRALFFQPTFF